MLLFAGKMLLKNYAEHYLLSTKKSYTSGLMAAIFNKFDFGKSIWMWWEKIFSLIYLGQIY